MLIFITQYTRENSALHELIKTRLGSNEVSISNYELYEL